MIAIEIKPLEGVGPIRLGVTREDARGAMARAGLPLNSSHGDSDYYCSSSIQVEHGPDSRVWFVGVSHSHAYRAVYRGVDVFRLSAEELFALAAVADQSGPHGYSADEYCFPKQILTLWAADTQYDYEGPELTPVWAQVGVGNELYATAVAELAANV
ncbi:hypothetical protein ACFFGH_34190 [Lysobacter korlensis]|uniref:Uncharacterized protein n=1 Tax=Lysobacter korlensis TaxID=553636 RepID=A0ABV6S1H1_9GAMM